MSCGTFITAAAVAGSVELVSVAPEACGAVEVEMGVFAGEGNVVPAKVSAGST